jgi:enoyl-CoA hydratase
MADGDAARERPVLSEALEGGVRVITLNRPEVRNAVNFALAKGLAGALDDLDADPGAHVGVLTGAGGCFCSGMDLKALATMDLRAPGPEDIPFIEGHGLAGISHRASQKPLIAAIEGSALAGGLEVAIACDLLVASEDALLGVPEVRRGLAPLAGGLVHLPRRIPYHFAMELALTGEPITAGRAHELGLVNRVVAPGTALDEALVLARQIARNAPVGVRASTAVIRGSRNRTVDESWEQQHEHAAAVVLSADAREGARAFAEGRDPVWQGR